MHDHVDPTARAELSPSSADHVTEDLALSSLGADPLIYARLMDAIMDSASKELEMEHIVLVSDARGKVISARGPFVDAISAALAADQERAEHAWNDHDGPFVCTVFPWCPSR